MIAKHLRAIAALAATVLLVPAVANAGALTSNFDLSVEASVNDSFAQGPQTGAVYLFGVGGQLGADSALVFTNESGRFYSTPGGAVLTGEVAMGVANGTTASLILDASRRFNLEMRFVARGSGTTANTATGDGFGGPKLELKPSAFLANGGAIDPNNWAYFDMIGATLRGVDAFAGVEIQMTQIPANSEFPFQFGDGASGRNTQIGGSAWFNWSITNAGNDSLGAVGKNGVGDVYVQGRCANDAGTASSSGLALCPAGSVPLPPSLALFGLGGLALLRRTRSA
jgi:hypothetical protein